MKSEKVRYILPFSRDKRDRKMLICTNDVSPCLKDICQIVMSSITHYSSLPRNERFFKIDNYQSIPGGDRLPSGYRLYADTESHMVYNIYSKATDMRGIVIPDTYYIQTIALYVED